MLEEGAEGEVMSSGLRWWPALVIPLLHFCLVSVWWPGPFFFLELRVA